MKRILFIFSFLLIFSVLYPQAEPEKRRIIVLTDPNIDPNKETDDAMSLVRLMVYSNEFDIEGLIATCSHNLQYRYVEPILLAIDKYEEVLPNLEIHANGYPNPDYLRSITALGPRLYGTQFALSETPISDGAQIVIDAINKSDDRPIWIQIWGDGATIAQALEHIRKTEGNESVQNAVSKLRIVDMAGQDDSGAWLKSEDNYPDLFYIRWENQFSAMDVYSDMNLNLFPYCGECGKGEPPYGTDEWFDEHIRNHGPLGSIYYERRWVHEGDSPTLLLMIPNGLNDPEKPWQGSWGGRFTREPVTGIRSYRDPLGSKEWPETMFDPYYMYGPDIDTWNGYTSTYASIFRWWVESYNDFASRMDWSINLPNANHPPIVSVEKNLTVCVGDTINLEAEFSDPDGDNLNFQWWYYKEAGTYTGDISINGNEIIIPSDSRDTEVHFIISVTDDGEPPLTRYGRIVLNIIVDEASPSIPNNIQAIKI
jgi:hypothetical protein